MFSTACSLRPQALSSAPAVMSCRCVGLVQLQVTVTPTNRSSIRTQSTSELRPVYLLKRPSADSSSIPSRHQNFLEQLIIAVNWPLLCKLVFKSCWALHLFVMLLLPRLMGEHILQRHAALAQRGYQPGAGPASRPGRPQQLLAGLLRLLALLVVWPLSILARLAAHTNLWMPIVSAAAG